MPDGGIKPNAPSNPQVAQKVVGAIAPAANSPLPPSNPGLSQLTDAQVERIVKAIIYGSIASGIVFARPGVTPSAKNLEIIAKLGDAVMELVG